MTETAHIEPEIAEELHDGDDGDTAGGWRRVADVRGDSGRWRERRTLVVADGAGLTWGLAYAVGLTENQDYEFPWRGATGPLPLTRLYPHVVTRTVYRTVPADGGAR